MRRLKVGDLVEVIAGKYKPAPMPDGSVRRTRGVIKRILRDRDRVIIEGVNLVVRHTRPSQQNTEGGRVTKEASIHASNVMPVDAETDEPTRVKVAADGDGKKTRVAAGRGAALKQA